MMLARQLSSVAIISPTARDYTGTEADYDRLGVPATLRPRPVVPGDEKGGQLGRKWDAEKGE